MSETLPAPSRDWAMFLDVDGTLLDLAATPDSVTVPSDLPDRLTRLEIALDGAVAIISGRPVATLDRFFAPLHLAAAGLHGGELRRARGGMIARSPPAPRLREIRRCLDRFAAAHPGVIIEDKGSTIAAHYRQAVSVRTALEALLRDAVAGDDELVVMPAHMAFEVKPRSFDKGTAIEALMAEAPFHGRIPLFIGDDRTDEDGFAAVESAGGHGIRVGCAGESRARFRLPDPAAVRQFLARVATTLIPEETAAASAERIT